MHREPSLSLDNKPPESTLPRGARHDLVCEKIKDLNKTGHILQAGGGGHRVVFYAAAAAKITKGEENKENRLQIA